MATDCESTSDYESINSDDEDFGPDQVLILDGEVMKDVIQKLMTILNSDYFDFLFDVKLKPFRENGVMLDLPSGPGPVDEFEDGVKQGLAFHIHWKFGMGSWFYPFSSSDEMKARVTQICEVLKTHLPIFAPKDPAADSSIASGSLDTPSDGVRVEWGCDWDTDQGIQYLIFSPKDYYVCTKVPEDYGEIIKPTPILSGGEVRDSHVYYTYSQV